MNTVYEDYGTQKARDIARQYKSQYGQLVRVVCSPHPKTITLIYANGTQLLGKCDDGYFMQFGYMGGGTSNFWAFLNENAFHMSYDDLIQLGTHETIMPETTQLSQQHQQHMEHLKEQIRRREEEEEQQREREKLQMPEKKQREREEERRRREQKYQDEQRSRVQFTRKSSGQCIMCGQRLNFVQKLFGKERHSTCTSFKE